MIRKAFYLLILMMAFLSQPVSAVVDGTSGYGIVQGYNTRFSTLELDRGQYRVARGVLKANRSKLRSGTVVRYVLKNGGEEFPEGIISSIQVFEGAKTVCDIECN